MLNVLRSPVEPVDVLASYPHPILVCGIAWMERYRGQKGTRDTPLNGGKYVKIYGLAHEVCNFLACPDGLVYGYVPSFSGGKETKIRLNQLESKARDEAIHLKGVTVLWVATPPEGGRRIIGWYRDATVYRAPQYFKNHQPASIFPSIQHKKDNINSFRITANACNAFLLPMEKRDNYALDPAGTRKGWLGQKSWWYPLKKTEYPDVKKFMTQIIEELLLDSTHRWENCTPKIKPTLVLVSPDSKAQRNVTIPDLDDQLESSREEKSKADIKFGSEPVSFEERKEVEDAAVKWVKDYYLALRRGDCDITSVEKDNLGWDLKISRLYSGRMLVTRVEVKGRSGKQPLVGLSPNEFKALLDNPRLGYRLGIVINALTTSPTLYLCRYHADAWIVEQHEPTEKSFVTYKKEQIECHHWDHIKPDKSLRITPLTSALVEVVNIAVCVQKRSNMQSAVSSTRINCE